MDLMGYCLRCGRHFCGPDEGCPTCDRNNPDVTSARNRHPSDAEVAEFMAEDGPDDGPPKGWDCVEGGPERPDVSALLAGDRYDCTADELAELVRLARLGAEVERQAQLHDGRADLAAALYAEQEG